MVESNGSKPLSCVLDDGVRCSFRKDAKFRITARCLKCPEYEKFERAMAEDEEEDSKFADEMQKHPDRYPRGDFR